MWLNCLLLSSLQDPKTYVESLEIIFMILKFEHSCHHHCSPSSQSPLHQHPRKRYQRRKRVNWDKRRWHFTIAVESQTPRRSTAVYCIRIPTILKLISTWESCCIRVVCLILPSLCFVTNSLLRFVTFSRQTFVSCDSIFPGRCRRPHCTQVFSRHMQMTPLTYSWLDLYCMSKSLR